MSLKSDKWNSEEWNKNKEVDLQLKKVHTRSGKEQRKKKNKERDTPCCFAGEPDVIGALSAPGLNETRRTACERRLCHDFPNKTLLNPRTISADEWETRQRRKNGENLKHRIKFEKNLIFKTNLNNSRRIMQFYSEDSLESNVGCWRTTVDKKSRIGKATLFANLKIRDQISPNLVS